MTPFGRPVVPLMYGNSDYFTKDSTENKDQNNTLNRAAQKYLQMDQSIKEMVTNYYNDKNDKNVKYKLPQCFHRKDLQSLGTFLIGKQILLEVLLLQ